MAGTMGKSFENTILFVRQCAKEIEADADKTIRNEELRLHFKRGMKTMLSRILCYCSISKEGRYRTIREIKDEGLNN